MRPTASDSPAGLAHKVEQAALLRFLGEVAYLRFAAVYRGFQSAADFEGGSPRELSVLPPRGHPRS